MAPPNPTRRSGARTDRLPLGRRLRAWAVNHLQTSLASLGRLYGAPGSSFMTVAVIGIALALPTGLDVMIANASRLSGAWDGQARISMFLKKGVAGDKATALAQRVRERPDVSAVEVITPRQALAEFKAHSGFAAAVDALATNPLPAVLVVHPALSASSPAAASALAEGLRALPQADSVQLDTRWLRRLRAILELVRRAILIISILLAAAVIIITGNTIRLDIQNRRHEIEVTKLVGATNSFIRRPFLYTGLWYGLLGGLSAWLLVSIGLWLLAGPVGHLAGLYGTTFSLSGVGAGTGLGLLMAGAGLGWLGAWLSVARHLHAIEPA
jgi:cell division transport system permease protein